MARAGQHLEARRVVHVAGEDANLDQGCDRIPVPAIHEVNEVNEDEIKAEAKRVMAGYPVRVTIGFKSQSGREVRTSILIAEGLTVQRNMTAWEVVQADGVVCLHAETQNVLFWTRELVISRQPAAPLRPWWKGLFQ